MSRSLLVGLVVVIGIAGLALAGCKSDAHSSSSSPAADTDCPGCEKTAETGTGWCDHCGKGAVNGEKVDCKGCYEEKTGGPPCAACSK